MKNKYRFEDGVCRIQIKFKGNVIESLIDTEDFNIADSFEGTWYGSQYSDGGQIYVTGTDHNRGDRISLKLHRLITGAKEDEVVDHINRNGLDNRRSNLRVVSLKENAQNLSVSRDNTSGYRGVSFKKDKQKYKAYLTTNRKQIHVGYFDTAEEANEAVIVARKKFMPYSFEERHRIS